MNFAANYSLASQRPSVVYRCACTPERTTFFFNQAILDLSGYCASDFIDDQVLTFTSIIHPQDRQQVQQVIFQAVELGQAFEIQYRIIHADGRLRWVYDCGRGIRGMIERFWLDGVMLELGDRLLSENEIESQRLRGGILDRDEPVEIPTYQQTVADLLAAHQRLNFHVENSPLAVVEWGADFRVQRWSKRAETIFGWSALEVMGKHFSEWRFVHEADQAVVQQTIVELRQGTSNTCFNRNYTRDGEIIHCEWYNSVLLDSQGRALSILSLALDVTDRWQAEQQRQQIEISLRESEARHRTICELTSDYFFCCRVTPEGLLEDEWEAVGRESWLTQLTLSTLAVGLQGWLELVYPQDHALVSDFIHQVIAKNQAASLEYRLLNPQGEIRWVRDRMLPQWCPLEQRVIRIFGAMKDITTDKQKEIALQTSEQRFRSLVNNIPGAVYRSAPDPERTDAWISEEIINICGYPATDFIGQQVRSLASIIHPEDRQRVSQRMDQAIAEKRPYVTEYRIIHADGRIRWVFEKGQGVFDPQGNVLWLDGVILDITDRKHIETTLRHSEQRYRSLVDNMPGAVFRGFLGSGLNVEFISNQIYAISGYPASDFMNRVRNYTSMIHPQDLQWVHQSLEEAISQRWSYSLEYRILHANGSIRWVLDQGQASVAASTDLVVYIDGVIFDITEQKQAELSLKVQAERERLLGGIALKIRQFLKLEDILNATTAEVQQLLQSDRVIIAGTQASGPYRVMAESMAVGWQSCLGLALEETWFQERLEFYRQGHAESVHDLTSEALSGELHLWMKEWRIQSHLAVPILLGEKLWGIIALHQCSHPRNWQPYEITLLEQLATQVAIAIQQAELYQQLEAANQELQRLAVTDSLTQLANRRRFNEYLEQEWRRLKREQAPLSLILCDIDYFKSFNDSFGHLAGDNCLQQVAQILSQVAQRPADLVVRFGGEEFALILPHTPAAGAVQLVEAIQSQLKGLRFPLGENQLGQPGRPLTLSFGVATVVPNEHQSLEILVAIADQALYQAKAEGRNRYVRIMLEG